MKYIFIISAAISVLSYIVTSHYSKKLGDSASGLWREINSSITINPSPVTKKTIDRLLALSTSLYSNKENKKASLSVFLLFVFFANSSLSLSYFFQYFLLFLGSGKEPSILNETTFFMAALPAAISVKIALSISDSRDRLLSVHDHLSPMDTNIPLLKLQSVKQDVMAYSYLTKVLKTKRHLTSLEWHLVCKSVFNDNGEENNALLNKIKKELFFGS